MTQGHSGDPPATSEGGLVLPLAGRGDDAVAGHWLLARLGKRVLRPGGAALTAALLDRAEVADADVVELAPGLGRTAAEIIARRPGSYVGVEQDPDAARAVRGIVGAHGTVRVADAARTGLPSGSADVVIGEAMLSMQNDTSKTAIIAEAARLLRPGGRYAIHELALTPDTVPEATKAAIARVVGPLHPGQRPPSHGGRVATRCSPATGWLSTRSRPRRWRCCSPDA